MKVNNPNINHRDLLFLILKMEISGRTTKYIEILDSVGYEKYGKTCHINHLDVPSFLPTLSQDKLNILHNKLRANFKFKDRIGR